LNNHFISVKPFFVNLSYFLNVLLDMIEFLYFSNKKQVFQKISSLSDSVLIVTPSPAKADSLRSYLTYENNFDVITIAKFTSDLLSKTQIEGGGRLKKKSDLLLIFAVLRDKYFSNLSFDQFLISYDIFSDLRSFTTNFEILSAILKEFPEEISQPVELLDKIMNLTGFMDEHSAYAYLAQEIRLNETIFFEGKSIVFWGFNHLNGQQVDLLKALSLRNNVFIPLPFHLKNKFKRGDWVNWIRDISSSEIVLDNSDLAPHGLLHRVNSREFSKNLSSFIIQNDQVLLGVSKLTPQHVHLVPHAKVSYKIPVEFLKIDLEIFFQELKQEIKKMSSLAELEIFLKLIKPESLKKIKIVDLYQDAIKTVRDFTDQEIKLDEFFLKVLNLVVQRNQPRLFLAPLSIDELDIEIKDFSSLDSLDHKKRTLVCIDDRFDPIGSLSGSKYTEVINSLLATIGPVKRADLDIEFKIWEIHSLMTSSEVHVFLTEESLKFNLIWKRFFSDVKFSNIENTKINEKVITDDLNTLVKETFTGDFSASKIQSYLDCKRKFYFSFVDKKFPLIKLNNSLTTLQLGSLSHKVIEVFFKKNIPVSGLNNLTNELLHEFVSSERLNIFEEKLKEYFLICYQRALNGIQILKSIENSIEEKVIWKMEHDFSFHLDGFIKGKIDCIGESENYTLLFDFKSSATPSYVDFENFENLQLWIYSLSLAKEKINETNKKLILGYISLDNPIDSKIMACKDEVLGQIDFNESMIKIKKLNFNFTEKSQEANEYIRSTILSIKEERVFLPNPRNDTICLFCELRKICPKGSL